MGIARHAKSFHLCPMSAFRSIALILLAVISVACRKPEPARQEIEKTRPPEVAQLAPPKKTTTESAQVASLIDPAKLATLKSRGANPRIMKIVAILYTAKIAAKNPETIVNGAITQIGWENTEKGNLTAAAILRNLDIAEELGATTHEDLAAMRKGLSPIVRRGPYAGDVLSVDHIIPRAVAPELDNCIANLELMPLRLNQSKSDSIGPRQRDLANKLHAAGLLTIPKKL